MFDTIVDFVTEYSYAVTIVSLVLAFMAWLGLFSTITVEETKFPGGYFFYKDIQVSNKRLGPVFCGIENDIEAYHKT